MNRPMLCFCGVLTLGLALPLSGCGGGGADTPELGLVSGTVTLDGEPLSNVMVVFEPQGADAGRASMAKTDEQGHYELGFNATEKGAAVGTHKVSVSTPTEAPDPTGEFKDPIPAKYNTETELTKEVKPGEQTIDLALES